MMSTLAVMAGFASHRRHRKNRSSGVLPYCSLAYSALDCAPKGQRGIVTSLIRHSTQALSKLGLAAASTNRPHFGGQKFSSSHALSSNVCWTNARCRPSCEGVAKASQLSLPRSSRTRKVPSSARRTMKYPLACADTYKPLASGVQLRSQTAQSAGSGTLFFVPLPKSSTTSSPGWSRSGSSATRIASGDTANALGLEAESLQLLAQPAQRIQFVEGQLVLFRAV